MSYQCTGSGIIIQHKETWYGLTLSIVSEADAEICRNYLFESIKLCRINKLIRMHLNAHQIWLYKLALDFALFAIRTEVLASKAWTRVHCDTNLQQRMIKTKTCQKIFLQSFILNFSLYLHNFFFPNNSIKIE